MELKEMLKQGYVYCGRAWTRGYTSRRNYSEYEAEIHKAGGSRNGQIYILAPAWNSTMYCWRHYYKQPDKASERIAWAWYWSKKLG